jgi:hypothetical protein
MTTPEEVLERVSPSPIEHWQLSQEFKDKNVENARVSLELFLNLKTLEISENLQNKILEKYQANASEFKEKMYSPAHDENHLAGVTLSATEIISEKAFKIPESKRKLVGLALIISTIEHDLGDIPEEGMKLSECLKHEEKSAEKAEEFIESMEELTDNEKEELKALSKTMIIGTSPPLNLGTDLENLKITKAISSAYSGNEVSIPVLAMDEDQRQEFAGIIKSSVATLKKYGWEENDILYAQRLMAASDYASYLRNPSLIEPTALWVEQNDLYIDEKGTLKSGYMSSFETWMQPTFRENVHKLYQDFLPTSIEPIYNTSQDLLHKFKELEKKQTTDLLFRLEGGIPPADLLRISDNLELSGDKEIQEALLKYGASFVRSFENPKQEFSGLATKAIDIIYKKAKESGKDQKLFEKVLGIIDTRLSQYNDSAVLYLSPLAYTDSDFASGLIAEWNKGKEDNYKNILNIGLTIRLDKDSQNIEGIDLLSQSTNDPEKAIEIGGHSSKENLNTVLNTLPKDKNRAIIIHSGYTSEGENQIEQLNYINEAAQDKEGNYFLAIDKNPNEFLTWFKNLSQGAQESFRNKFSLMSSPLAEVIRNPNTITDWQEISKLFPDMIIVSNNSSVMAGGAGISFLQVFAKDQLKN